MIILIQNGNSTNRKLLSFSALSVKLAKYCNYNNIMHQLNETDCLMNGQLDEESEKKQQKQFLTVSANFNCKNKKQRT